MNVIPHIPLEVAKRLKPGHEVSINHEGGYCVIDNISTDSYGNPIFEVGANEYTYEYINNVYSFPYDSEKNWTVTPDDCDDDEFGFLSHNCNPYCDDGYFVNDSGHIDLDEARSLKYRDRVYISQEGRPTSVRRVDITDDNVVVHLFNGKTYNYTDVMFVC